MAIDIKQIINDLYTTFAGEIITAVGTDSKELITTAAGYLADAKSSLSAIGIAALASTDPMSWQEVKLKLAEEGKIAEAAFLSVEQQLASDLQSFVNTIISLFEKLLTNQLMKLQQQQS